MSASLVIYEDFAATVLPTAEDAAIACNNCREVTGGNVGAIAMPLSNARHAPELLRTLKIAERYFRENGGNRDYTWLWEISAAIRAAEGG